MKRYKLRYHTTPWRHQRQALKFLYPRDVGALFLDMGGGKTKVIIDMIVNRGWKKVLIVAPKKVCRVWAPEFLIHAPNEQICVLSLANAPGDRKSQLVREAWEYGKFDQLVVVVNYDSIWREPFKSFILKFGFDAVICDESHRIKAPGSKCSKMLTLLGKRVKHRYLMTGTPLAQNPLDIYAQYRFLDPTIFGTRNDVFKSEYGNWIQGRGYPMLDKRNPYKNLDQLHDKMFSVAFNVEIEDTLPPTQDIQVDFDMSPEAQKHYKELRKEGVLELAQGDVTAGNVLAIMTRLRQLCSGYLPVEDDDGKKKIIDIDDSRRVALKELLEDLPEDEPVVVFATFTKDILNIRRVVRDLGCTSSELSGKRDTMHRWEAGLTRVLVVQIASGAEGINLTRARYNIYYTMTNSLVKYQQSRKRSHRPGQTRPVIYYKLVARMAKGKTIDQRIIEALDNNQEIVTAIMNDEDRL